MFFLKHTSSFVVSGLFFRKPDTDIKMMVFVGSVSKHMEEQCVEMCVCVCVYLYDSAVLH